MAENEKKIIHPGDWCANCTVPIRTVEYTTKSPGWTSTGIRKEPCATIMEEYQRTGEPDSRCNASLQAAFNRDNGIPGSL